MNIVIEIDESAYDWLKNGYPDEKDGEYAINVIKSGTPLPKGHGRLIDADKLKRTMHDIYVESIGYRHRCVSVENIDNAPTIIPADKEENK